MVIQLVATADGKIISKFTGIVKLQVASESTATAATLTFSYQ